MKKLFLCILLFPVFFAGAQVRFSFATDVSVVRNFSPHQRFWAIGQTIQGQFHFNERESFYTWLMYYSPGRFSNEFIAEARNAGTTPSKIAYTMKGLWNMKEFSMGIKHYFKGGYNIETGWHLYGQAGFGLMFTGIQNSLRNAVDTSLYQLAEVPREGSDEFKRLTIDLGMGVEVPLGGDFFVYTDARTYIPSSSYPSTYLHNTKNVPLPLMINLGVRILFGNSEE